MQEQTYFGKGKLLLTGEYFVLDGALALALPTSLGQKLTISPRNDGVIHKMSVDNLKKCWYLGIFDPKTLQILEYKDAATSKRLQQIFTAIRELKPDFLKNTTGVTIKTELDFPRDWGLGTSSTLVYTLAKWADVNPFDLLKKTFGGSGYDIACAEAEGSIFYQINRNNGRPRWATVDFDPTFKDQLYFVYLGQKQNSREGIKRYREMKINGKAIETISKISALLPKVKTLEEFERVLEIHENVISETLDLPKAKDLHFKDYWGIIKSLGAWGGDFVLATSTESPEKTKAYFNERGFEIVLPYRELIYSTDQNIL